MSKKWRTIGAALGAAAVGAAGTAYYWLLQRPLPQTSGEIRLKGLHHPVEIIRDKWGVPHIYAQNHLDLLFAQGFVHAQDRLWQMEFWRRIVSGRLSEILGSRSVAMDRWVRTLGFRRLAEKEIRQCDPLLLPELEAYVAGVNVVIAQGRFPVEFSILRFDPEPWQVVDLFGWSKMMAWQLSVNWQTEIARAQLIELLGAELAGELEEPYELPLVVPAHIDYSHIGSIALQKAQEAAEFIGPDALSGLGSNNWVVGGNLTNTGRPLLANDMHLLISTPSIWYENHLVCEREGLNVTGVSFAGIPYVVVGHNQNIAWAFTNGFPDVQDLYMERLRQSNGKTFYEYKEEWLEATTIQEQIKVRGAEPVIEEVVLTHHGPIINNLIQNYPQTDPVGETPLALCWTAYQPSEQLKAIRLMNMAQNCTEFHQATRYWTVPVQNMVYADTAGNIAYTFPGLVPIRTKGDGRVPVPGWTGEYEWTGFIPFEDLPHFVNPIDGYIVSANHRVVNESYPYLLGFDFSIKDRAVRIHELIQQSGQLTLERMKKMQFDTLSPTARAMVPFWRSLQLSEPDLAVVVQMMAEWDGNLAANSAPAAVHELFMRQLLQLTLGKKLDKLMMLYAGKGPTPILADTNQLGARSWEWLLRMMDNPNSHWFDQGQGENRDALMRQALRLVVDRLKKEQGANPADWSWGRLHQLTYRHPLGIVKPLDKLFNRASHPIGGDGTTVFATGLHYYDLAQGDLVGAPHRMVVDVGNWNNSVSMVVPGQSGQPGSKHYDDQADSFHNAQYHPMLYDRADVQSEAEEILWLRVG